MQGKNIAALDGVRGLAILSVMVYHFTFRHLTVTPAGRALLWLTGLGWSGVDMFFLLSGFLITRILLRERGSAGYYKNFYARRVLRIFPLYYALLFAVFVVSPQVVPWRSAELVELSGRQIWLWSYLSNVDIFVHGRWMFNVEWVALNHLWSLAVEEHFYLVWPLLVGVLAPRALTRLCVILVLGVPVLRFALIELHVAPPLATYVFSPCRMDALALGGLLAIQLGETGRPWVSALLTRLAWPAMGAGLAAVLGIVALQGGTSHNSWPMQCVGFPGFALAYGALIVLAVSALPGTRIHRVLTSSLLSRAGKYSYGGYVFHEVLQPAFERYLPPSRFAPLPEVVAILLHALLAIGVSFGVALLSWHLLEKRFLGLKRHFDYA
jgi:peptidoglycan/LPS O-acetylase OafA/YrhL